MSGQWLATIGAGLGVRGPRPHVRTCLRGGSPLANRCFRRWRHKKVLSSVGSTEVQTVVVFWLLFSFCLFLLVSVLDCSWFCRCSLVVVLVVVVLVTYDCSWFCSCFLVVVLVMAKVNPHKPKSTTTATNSNNTIINNENNNNISKKIKKNENNNDNISNHLQT